MSSEDNKLLVRRYIAEVINTGNVGKIEEFISPDHEEIHEAIRHPIGVEGAKEHITGVRQTYPDLTLTVDRQIAEGECVATCVTARGIHKGIWMEIEPTGKPVRILIMMSKRSGGPVDMDTGRGNCPRPCSLDLSALNFTLSLWTPLLTGWPC